MIFVETWKDIQGYEGYYMASNFGRIKSLDRLVKNGNGERKARGRIMKFHKCKKGYLRANLRKDGSAKSHLVHRLVANAFIKNKYNKKTVNHKDANKSNNRVENLEWMTHQENVDHAVKMGLMKDTPRALEARVQASAKKTSKPIKIISPNGKITVYESMREAERKTNLNRRSMGRVISGTIKDFRGYKITMMDKETVK